MSDKIKIGKYDLSAKPTHILLLKLGRDLKLQNRYFDEYSKLQGTSEMESFNQDFIIPLSQEISLLKWSLNCPAGNDDNELYIEYFNRNENEKSKN